MKPPGGQLCIWFKWLWIPTRDLTDVTLVSEDTDDQDDSDDRDNKMVKKMKRMKKVKKMKTIRRWRRWRINYHYYSDYSQKWARRKFIVFSREWIPYIYIYWWKYYPRNQIFDRPFYVQVCQSAGGANMNWRNIILSRGNNLFAAGFFFFTRLVTRCLLQNWPICQETHGIQSWTSFGSKYSKWWPNFVSY